VAPPRHRQQPRRRSAALIARAQTAEAGGFFDALGASGVSEDLLLDRHWRNARTLASHNPRVYKARILGDWLINDKDPLPNLAKLGRGGQGN
jgi:alkylation response protein AidB-like acyl-CoA dehydrogenase